MSGASTRLSTATNPTKSAAGDLELRTDELDARLQDLEDTATEAATTVDAMCDEFFAADGVLSGVWLVAC